MSKGGDWPTRLKDAAKTGSSDAFRKSLQDAYEELDRDEAKVSGASCFWCIRLRLFLAFEALWPKALVSLQGPCFGFSQ